MLNVDERIRVYLRRMDRTGRVPRRIRKNDWRINGYQSPRAARLAPRSEMPPLFETLRAAGVRWLGDLAPPRRPPIHSGDYAKWAPIVVWTV